MLQLCVRQGIEHLGSLESAQEARLSLGYASSNSYGSFVLSKLPKCLISRHAHADVWTVIVEWKWHLYLGKIICTFRKSTAAVSAKDFFFSFLLALYQAPDDNCIECWLLLLLRRWKFPILLPQSLMENMWFIAALKM